MIAAYRQFSWRQGEHVALFRAPFRPFFLLGAAWSALALALWLGALRGELALAPPYHGVNWHAHEMVYGFGAAVVGGFLLTAVPSWTGQSQLLGRGLAAASALWLAGRIAIMLSESLGVPAVATVDLGFLMFLSARTLLQVVAARNWHNIPVTVGPVALLLGNAMVHAEALGLGATASLGNRLGVAVIGMLIVIIGGRIIPAFTRNWLNNTGRGEPLPAVFNRFDAGVLLLTVATFALWLTAPAHPVTGAFAVTSAVLHGVRLGRWRGWQTISEPLVWILHLGYAWLPVAFVLIAGSTAVPATVPESAGLHALGSGAMATMMLAMMTRATLGHTGRRLSAGGATTGIYLTITLAGACRVAAALAPVHAVPLLSLGGGLWVAAFVLYLLIYAPMLCGARVAST